MRVKIKRVDPTLPLPAYQSEGAAAFDMYSRDSAKIQPGELVRLPSNLIIATPKGYMLHLVLRSGTPKKKPGLIVPHGSAIIDSDYCGPDDEILIQVMNVGDTVIEIERGERFAQGVFVKIDRANFVEAAAMRSKSRGGFGSTG